MGEAKRLLDRQRGAIFVEFLVVFLVFLTVILGIAQLAGVVQDGTPIPMVILVTAASVLAFVSIVVLPRLGRGV